MPRSDLPGKYAATKFSIREMHTPLSKGLIGFVCSGNPIPMPGFAELEDSVCELGQGSPIEGANTMFFVGTEVCIIIKVVLWALF